MAANWIDTVNDLEKMSEQSGHRWLSTEQNPYDEKQRCPSARCYLTKAPASQPDFTSYDRSAGTGLDYAVNRTHSPGQGRFTQADPLGMGATSIGEPQSNNLFAYTQNMPQDFVDPSGLLVRPFWIYDGTTCVLRDGAWDCEPQYHVEWIDDGTVSGPGEPPVDPPTHGDPGGGGTHATGPPVQSKDCKAFADEVEKFVNEHPQALLSQFAKWMYDRFSDSGREFSDKGFKKEFQDGSNQARHYAGGFFAGFTLGITAGLALMNGREVVGDLADSVTVPVAGIPIPIWTPNSVEDKALNVAAVKHGDDLNDGEIRIRDVPDLIRKEICN